MGLRAYIETSPGSDVWIPADASFENLVGTPLLSVEPTSDGQEIGGVYDIAFTSVVAGVSATVTVSCDNPDNPNLLDPDHSILLDGTTEYSLIVRGVKMVFSSSMSFTGSWAARLRIGVDFETVAGFGPDANTPQAARKIKVVNEGNDTASSCKARCLPSIRLWSKTGTVFARVRPFAEGAIEKLTDDVVSPYQITVANVTGSGAGKTLDVLVDGELVEIVRLNNQNNPVDGTAGDSEELGVVDFYRITSGDLTDTEWLLSQLCASGDTANLLVFSVRFIQIAPDQANSPGTFSTNDVVLTETGQAAGKIRAGGEAFFWFRVLIPANAMSRGNPYICSPCLQGSASNAAGWNS